MQLEQFITATLNQIMAGVRAAQQQRYLDGGVVNPLPRSWGQEVQKNSRTSEDGIIQDIEFDVAVTVESGSKSNVGGGIKVLALGGAGAGHHHESFDSTVSRIRFTVPITLPSGGKLPKKRKRQSGVSQG